MLRPFRERACLARCADQLLRVATDSRRGVSTKLRSDVVTESPKTNRGDPTQRRRPHLAVHATFADEHFNKILFHQVAQAAIGIGGLGHEHRALVSAGLTPHNRRMSTERLFLSARWQDLILLNYAVPDALLVPLPPAGLELDRYRGSAFVSLVAFDFLDTRVMGVRWSGYTNFAEINLRFYVRPHQEQARLPEGGAQAMRRRVRACAQGRRQGRLFGQPTAL
jgi:Uncharacterized conserved protein (COG2071)